MRDDHPATGDLDKGGERLARIAKFGGNLIGCGALAIAAMMALATSPVQAANIISFDDNATACGGAVLCSTNGTTGYSGTTPFDITTINSWFQVDAATSLIAGQPAQPMNAGDFLVVNNTGATLTGLTLTLNTTFNASTPSVGFCSGSSGPLCDMFQANKGAAGGAGAAEDFEGANLFSCSATPCTSTSGSISAEFNNNPPQQVTFTFSGYSIPAGGTFDIDFASWNDAAFAVPAPLIGHGLFVLLAVGGVLGGSRPWERSKKRRSLATAIQHAAA